MLRTWLVGDKENACGHKQFVKNVENWIEQGITDSELCFVWVEGLQLKAGVAYAKENDEQAVILDFSLSEDSLELGERVLDLSMEKLSVSKACYHLYNDSDQFSAYKQCFINAGFFIAQEKLSYRFNSQSVGEVEDKFLYKTFSDVGKDEFAKCVAIVTQGTLDRTDANDVAVYGETVAAENYVNSLKEIDFKPDIWELAFLDDRFIGLVIPSNFGSGYGGINYIGVAPAVRGNRYSDILLRRGTQSLLNLGVNTVIADIDILNGPLKGALERVGYYFFADEVVLEKTIEKRR
jgi:hypothetical protein